MGLGEGHCWEGGEVVSNRKQDREIADGFTITKVCQCFRCAKEAACIKFSMMTGYKLYTNYRLCPMCSVEMMNFLGADINNSPTQEVSDDFRTKGNEGIR